jgi:hypothetical protein
MHIIPSLIERVFFILQSNLDQGGNSLTFELVKKAFNFLQSTILIHYKTSKIYNQELIHNLIYQYALPYLRMS